MKIRLVTTEALPGGMAWEGWGLTEDSDAIIRFVGDDANPSVGQMIDVDDWQILERSERPRR